MLYFKAFCTFAFYGLSMKIGLGTQRKVSFVLRKQDYGEK